jgi:rubredoxin
MSLMMSDSSAATVAETPFRAFRCIVCGFIYNEAEGWPADGIAPGTRWEDVPDAGEGPDCGVTTAEFEMIEI